MAVPPDENSAQLLGTLSDGLYHMLWPKTETQRVLTHPAPPETVPEWRRFTEWVALFTGRDPRPLQSIASAAGVTLLMVQGALPIVRENRRIDGIGCSGAAARQDEDAARAGLAAAQ